MGTRVHVRLRTDLHPRGRGEDHRRQQHDRRVQTEHRGHDGRDAEHRDEQPRHQRAGRAEQALVGTEFGQDEHRGQKAHDGQQSTELGSCVVNRDRTRADDDAGRRDRDDRFGPPHRTRQREGQHRYEQAYGQNLAGGITHTAPGARWLVSFSSRTDGVPSAK